MSWRTWNIDTTEAAEQHLRDMILDLMREVVYDLEDPGFNEWYDAGIELGDGTGDMESIIVYRELQETDMTDIDGTYRPGFTLTVPCQAV